MKYGVTIVSIHTEYIKLDQFLKLSNIVQTGGEARFFILDNDVFVNGELEKRRGKKLRHGDTILVGNQEFQIEEAGAAE